MFSKDEKLFIETYIPSSRELSKKEIHDIDDQNILIKNKNSLVLKLTKSGMGQGVYIGNEFSKDEWISLLKKNSDHAIVQEYIKSIKYPAIIISEKEETITETMNGVLSMYSYSGEYFGCISRVSHSSVTNLIRGFLQPVYGVQCK